MLYKDALALFIALGLSYIVFMLAKKEKTVLQTLGYAIGMAIFLLSIIYAGAASQKSACMMQKKMAPDQHHKMKVANFTPKHVRM